MIDIDLIAEARNHVRIRRIKYEQFRKPVLTAKRPRQHLGTQRRAAHAAHHHVFETSTLNHVGKLDEFTGDADHLVGHRQPTERLADLFVTRVVSLPKRSILAPDAPRDARFFTFAKGIIQSVCEWT